jgi:hypothetical protein
MIHDIINISLVGFILVETYIYLQKQQLNKENDKFMTYAEDTAAYWKNLYEEQSKRNYLEKRDYDTVYDPLSPPERRVEADQYPYPMVVFNEKTRGEPDNYQLVGLLYNSDKNKNYQLYGRRKYPGAYEWEYYLQANDAGGLTVKMPIGLKEQAELYDGQQLTIPYDNVPYNVTIYNFDQPRYNPFPYPPL